MTNIVLPPDVDQYLENEVAQGRFPSVQEAACHLLRSARDNRQAYADLKSELQRRIEQVERGEYLEYDDESLKDLFDKIEAEVDAELAEERRKSAS